MGRLHVIYDPNSKLETDRDGHLTKAGMAIAVIDLPDNPALVERAVIDLGLKLAAYFHNPDV